MFSYNWAHGAWRYDNTDVGAVLQPVVMNFQHIRQGVPRCLTLLSYIMASYSKPGEKSAVYDCLIY